MQGAFLKLEAKVTCPNGSAADPFNRNYRGITLILHVEVYMVLSCIMGSVGFRVLELGTKCICGSAASSFLLLDVHILNWPLDIII